MKLKKRIKTIRKIESASVALNFDLFGLLPEDVMKKLDPSYERPTIGFKINEKKSLLT